SPHAYSFFQAVRILERAALLESRQLPLGGRALGAKNPVAGFVPPATEVVRFEKHQSFVFPEAEVSDIRRKSLEGQSSQWLMNVNFMGLIGGIGILPYHYTELILQRLKQKYQTLVHSLNLFNHRSISLLYQAATKYHLPIEYERKKLSKNIKEKRDIHTQ